MRKEKQRKQRMDVERGHWKARISSEITLHVKNVSERRLSGKIQVGKLASGSSPCILSPSSKAHLMGHSLPCTYNWTPGLSKQLSSKCAL